MKKTILILFAGCSIMLACNSSGSSTGKTDSATTAPAPVPAASEQGLELIGASDCTTCHKLHKSDPGSVIGPYYAQVAAKYSPAPDTTVDRLVQKVISGGSGVWGTTPMTPHPALTPADVKIMVTYILSLKD